MNNEKSSVTKTYFLYFAWIVSIVATGGSLYFSEVLGWIPCDLCWYQRIFMYPLPILLGIATFKQDFSVVKYALPFPIVGIIISTYHYSIQQIPSLAAARPCKSGIPCSADYLNLANGYITIPALAFLAFLLIIVSLLMLLKKK